MSIDLHPRLHTLSITHPDVGTPHRLAYAEWGAPENPRVVLCVHGLTRNGRDFDFLARALADDCRVICPDMPGRGKSDYLPNAQLYNNLYYLYCIQALLKHTGVERYSWVGTSMGGILALMQGAAYPQQMERLVLNDIGAVISGRGLQRISGYVGKFKGFRTQFMAKWTLKLLLRPFGVKRKDQLQHYFDHSLVRAPNGRLVFAYDPAIAEIFGLTKGDKKYFEDVSLMELWDKITCPVLVIRGAESDILTRETALRMQQTHPQVELHEVPRVGHAPTLMDEPEIRRIRAFVLAAP